MRFIDTSNTGGDVWVPLKPGSARLGPYTYVKRAVDVFLAISGLLVLSPLFLLIALIIKLESPGPVFFQQRRVGRNKQHFQILKFRTMRTDAPKDTPTHLLQNPDAFITRSGRFLRKSSLDELPQIVNILRGDMSFIGPRPALWNQEDLIAERDRYGVNAVLPGLTGWAQVNGRDELPIPTKAFFDGEYVKNMSLGFDMKIVLRTVRSVIRSDGVQEGTGTHAR